MNFDAVKHFSEQVSRIYDVLISLTKRVDKIEQLLCTNCGVPLNELLGRKKKDEADDCQSQAPESAGHEPLAEPHSPCSSNNSADS